MKRTATKAEIHERRERNKARRDLATGSQLHDVASIIEHHKHRKKKKKHHKARKTQVPHHSSGHGSHGGHDKHELQAAAHGGDAQTAEADPDDEFHAHAFNQHSEFFLAHKRSIAVAAEGSARGARHSMMSAGTTHAPHGEGHHAHRRHASVSSVGTVRKPHGHAAEGPERHSGDTHASRSRGPASIRRISTMMSFPSHDDDDEHLDPIAEFQSHAHRRASALPSQDLAEVLRRASQLDGGRHAELIRRASTAQGQGVLRPQLTSRVSSGVQRPQLTSRISSGMRPSRRKAPLHRPSLAAISERTGTSISGGGGGGSYVPRRVSGLSVISFAQHRRSRAMRPSVASRGSSGLRSLGSLAEEDEESMGF